MATAAMILFLVWLLGMISGVTLGTFIWVFLVIAVTLACVHLVTDR
jgi:hypothetical protein